MVLYISVTCAFKKSKSVAWTSCLVSFSSSFQQSENLPFVNAIVTIIMVIVIAIVTALIIHFPEILYILAHICIMVPPLVPPLVKSFLCVLQWHRKYIKGPSSGGSEDKRNLPCVFSYYNTVQYNYTIKKR